MIRNISGLESAMNRNSSSSSNSNSSGSGNSNTNVSSSSPNIQIEIKKKRPASSFCSYSYPYSFYNNNNNNNNNNQNYNGNIVSRPFIDNLVLKTPTVVINTSFSAAAAATTATVTAGYLSVGSIAPALAGGLSGIMTKVVTQPLDFLRTRLQMQDSRSLGIFTTFRTIHRAEGIWTFYRGLSASIMGSGFNWSAYFLMYELCKSGLSYYYNSKPMFITPANSQSQLNSFDHFICGYAAGASSVVITNPIWMIKTRLQMQTEYKGVFDCAKRIYLEEGLHKFYRGIIPGLALCSNKAIQFTVYEKLKCYANAYYFNPLHKSGNDTTLPSRYYLLMGGLSKIMSSSITYPMHLLRARLFQSNADKSSKYNGLIDCVKRVYKHEGAFGFYKGLSISLMKTVPGSALTFCFYENLMLLFGFTPKEYNRVD